MFCLKVHLSFLIKYQQKWHLLFNAMIFRYFKCDVSVQIHFGTSVRHRKRDSTKKFFSQFKYIPYLITSYITLLPSPNKAANKNANQALVKVCPDDYLLSKQHNFLGPLKTHPACSVFILTTSQH